MTALLRSATGAERWRLDSALARAVESGFATAAGSRLARAVEAHCGFRTPQSLAGWDCGHVACIPLSLAGWGFADIVRNREPLTREGFGFGVGPSLYLRGSVEVRHDD